jgi:drug/metabolite transporter (DMT)-like permease
MNSSAAQQQDGRGGVGPVVELVVAVACFTAGGVLAKGIGARAVDATALRLLIAGPLLLATSGVGPRRLCGLAATAVTSGLLFSVASLLSQVSFQRTSLANATLIPAVGPVLLTVAACVTIQQNRVRALAVPILVLAALTVFVRSGHDSGSVATGDAAAIGYLVAFNGYLLVTRSARPPDLSARAWTGLVMTVASVPLCVAAVLSGGPGPLPADDIARCLGIAALSTMIGQTLVTRASCRWERHSWAWYCSSNRWRPRPWGDWSSANRSVGGSDGSAVRPSSPCWRST